MSNAREYPCMGADAGSIARLSRLLSEGGLDSSAMGERASEIAALMRRWQHEQGLPRSELIVLGVNLHAYYTAFETLLERVARLLDEEVPSGPTWHRDLLLQMKIELPGLRPAVVASQLLPELEELRKFRHFFRNAYVLELDPHKTRAHGERVLTVHPQLAAGISALLSHVERMVQALAAG